jgi:hypothetical protein
MAILFMDGFDNTATSTHKWTSGGFTYGNTSPSTRFGTGKWGAYSTSALSKSLPTNYATLHCGAAVYFTGANIPQIAFQDAGSIQVDVIINTNGSISVRRGGSTVLGTTAPGLVPNNSWNHIGFKSTINNTTGTYDVWLNGVNVLTGTGANTRFTSNNYANQFSLGTVSGVVYFDDVYVGDTSGSAPGNDFIGDTRIDTQYPNGAGNYAQWTPSTGFNWQNVDETPPNGDTDYNSVATVGHIDSFTPTSVVPLTGVVYARQVNIYARKDDAATRKIAPLFRHSGADNVGADMVMPSSYAMFLQVFEQNPATTAAWTVSDCNNDEIGYKVTA